MGFAASEKEKALVISCPEAIDLLEIKAFDANSKNWLDTECPLIVLDFKETKEIFPAFYRPIVHFNQGAKSKKKVLCSINLHPPVLKKLVEDGLESVFTPVKSLSNALEKAGIKTKKSGLNTNFVTPFIQGTQLTLKVQANIPVKAGAPSLKKAGDVAPDIGITGVISLVSDQFNGSIALCFPTKVFLKIYSSMIGEETTEMSSDIEDAVGELLNIIFGQAKATLNNKHGYTIRTAIPTVLTGSKLTVHNSQTQTSILLPFESEFGTFHMEITTER